ncbi:MAG TPA: adenylate cyclase regulatory domain-containing protein [Candidatus Dormibacteraeota bacterium]|nr:adenylate cyclase regulatory domain-containing protein [Candidatus Dormibacteraeota bacterium]
MGRGTCTRCLASAIDSPPTERDLISAPRAELTGPEVAGQAGLDFEYVRRVWRALGMPEVDPNTPYFDQVDVETLRSLKRMIEVGLDPEAIIQNARVYGQAHARIAEVDARLFRHLYPKDGSIDEEAAVGAILEATQLQRQDAIRRHAALAVRDIVLSSAGADTSAVAVGFVDLVDFTQLSMDLHAEDLGQLISRFEEIAIDSTTSHGTRLVKLIGDAAMFVSPDAKKVLATARAAVAAVRTDAALFEARAGLDFGEVLAAGGDYYGTPVNTASRITGFARSGTVVASEPFVRQLDDASISMHDLGSQNLRGVGPTQLYKLREAEAETDGTRAPGLDGAHKAAPDGHDKATSDGLQAPVAERRAHREVAKVARARRKRARKQA